MIHMYFHALVIGRGGEQINLIQQQSSCRVQMSQESMGGLRQCTLQGTKHCIELIHFPIS
jgi:hypothetical protein